MAAGDASSTGVVIRFHDTKGYGFIKPDEETGEDLFVHQSEIKSEGYRSLKEGQKVKFLVVEKNDRKQAVNVTSLDPINNTIRNNRRSVGQGYTGNNIVRKECYNCGGVGHIARDCSSAVVVIGGGAGCYNCGGMGHLARECTRGNGGSGGIGRSSGAGCYNCGESGHLARECTGRPSGGARSGGGCFNCGESGHVARECTGGGGRVNVRSGDGCYNCGESGHIARDCTSGGGEYSRTAGRGSGGSGRASGGYKSGGGAGGGCYNCGESGHFARECPGQDA